MRRWWSGLSQQTVNLSPSGFVGSNPTRRTNEKPYAKAMGFSFVRRRKSPTRLSCWIRKPFPYECNHEWKRCTEPVRFEKRTRGPTSPYS